VVIVVKLGVASFMLVKLEAPDTPVGAGVDIDIAGVGVLGTRVGEEANTGMAGTGLEAG
jgi:hypothetical protein